jgi:hypothetical protein
MANDTATPIGRILVKNVRLGFPNLFEATVVGNDPKAKPRFSAMLIIPADHPQLEDIRAKQTAVAKEKWRDKAGAVMKGLEKQDKIALHDGDTKAQYDGLEGNFYLSAASQESAPPTVIDRDRSPLTSKSGRPYAGCYVNASVEIWAQDNQWGQRINCTLRGIQFFNDGESFSAGRPADADEFDEVDVPADEDFA